MSEAETISEEDLRAGDALLVVDVQVDFLPGGALGVAQGDAILPELNRFLDAFAQRSLPVFLTADAHPPGHCSFKEQGGPWPPHCVAGSEGARLAPDLKLPAQAKLVKKGQAPDRDAYSGFDGTELETLLRDAGAKRLFVGGLATDICVLESVKDAIARGFKVWLLVEAIRAVNLQPGDGKRAMDKMIEAGSVPCRWGKGAQ